MSDDVLSAALGYARRGWHVFPVRGKVPAIERGTSWRDVSTTDAEQIAAWWAGTSGLGIGVDLDKSRLAVVDIDHLADFDIDEKHLGDGWTYRGNRGRLAYMYGVNGHPVPQAGHPWGEVKAAGGYVVLPPSPHQHKAGDQPACTGGDECRYEWLDQHGDEPPVLPFDLEPLIAPKPKDTTPGETFDGDVSDWAVEEALRRLALLAGRLGGEVRDRNIRLNDAAMALGHYAPHYLSEKAIGDALFDASTANGLVKDDGARSVRATIASGLKAGMADPLSLEVKVTLLDVPASVSRLPFTLPDDFWCTDELRMVRQAAHSAQLGAAGLLGSVLARVSMQTHHSIELPRTRNRGSLNLFVGLVVESGGGKGSSVETASRLLPGVETPCICGDHDEGDYITLPPGSGEGITRAFWENVREGRGRVWRRDRQHVLLDVDEIESLLAITGRQGATIGPVLRSMWSGAKAGFQNASADRRFPLAPGTYRVAMVAGVQPSVVARLFDESMGGTPQRFLWMPAHAMDVPDIEAGPLPAWPGTLPPVQHEAIGTPWMPYSITVADPVRREMEVRRNRIARRVEKRDPLDAHRDFMQLRVAALLARLHRETEVSEQWWGLAAMVMRLSDEVRASMLSATREQEEQRDRVAGVRAARRMEATEQAGVERIEKVAGSMWRAVGRHVEEGRHEEGSCAKRCLMNAPGGRHSPEVKKQALEWALDHGWIEENGQRFVLGSSMPREV